MRGRQYRRGEEEEEEGKTEREGVREIEQSIEEKKQGYVLIFILKEREKKTQTKKTYSQRKMYERKRRRLKKQNEKKKIE